LLFNSWPFVFLLLATACVYFGLCRSESHQIYTLIVASLLFYSYGQASLVLLLVLSIVINTVACYKIESASSKQGSRIWATVGIVVNLGILALFKYAGLFAGMLWSTPEQAGGMGAWLVQLPLPIGISFYTFQGISLLADTFSGDFKQGNRRKGWFTSFRDSFFFISFFPQLVAGPVVKAKQFIPQIGQKQWRSIDKHLLLHCLITGYFLKMVVADNLKDQTFWIQFPYFENRSSIDLLIMLLSYSAQIFADFAGYSLIAIGAAALFGYTLPKNFNFPYISRSIAEFWRRWHISLSSWLREYLYFPLGGNRMGEARTYFNLMVVMFLGGLWHGAAWSFAVWGLWHGVGLALERAAGNMLKSGTGNRVVHKPNRLLSLCVDLGRWVAVFLFVSFGWLLFKLTDINEAFLYLASIRLNIDKSLNLPSILTSFILITPVVIYHGLYLVSSGDKKKLAGVSGYFYGAMLFLILFNAGSSEAFVYFQF